MGYMCLRPEKTLSHSTQYRLWLAIASSEQEGLIDIVRDGAGLIHRVRGCRGHVLIK